MCNGKCNCEKPCKECLQIHANAGIIDYDGYITPLGEEAIYQRCVQTGLGIGYVMKKLYHLDPNETKNYGIVFQKVFQRIYEDMYPVMLE